MNRKEVALAITNLETYVAQAKAELDRLDARLKVVEATVPGGAGTAGIVPPESLAERERLRWELP